MSSRHQMSLPQWMAIEIFIMAVIGLILGFLGPFGTYQMPTGLRLIYWVGFIIVGYFIFRPIAICSTWLSEHFNFSHWLGALMATALAALPLSVMIGFAISGMQFDPVFFNSGFMLLYLQCAVIGFAIYALMRVVFPESPPQNNAAEPFITVVPGKSEPSTAIQTTLHKRLPIGFPDHILALSVEDHYVRVHASDRSEMILMRLVDAIDEVGEIEGLQVHRSWWVAKSAISAAKRDGRNMRLTLSNGLVLPVSRSNVGKLKQTGWIS